MARIKYYNPDTQAWEYADLAGKQTTVNNYNQNFYAAKISGKYDLKSGVDVTSDTYIDASGNEVVKTNLGYRVTGFVPVKGGVEYITFGNGYALYDSEQNFIKSVINTGNYGEVREFTPEKDGYVRVSCRNDTYSRLCEKSEMYKCKADYLPAISPMSDPSIPCDIDLYGDSNSYGHGLSDVSKSWANRLGALITAMPETIRNYPASRMSVFSDVYSGSPKLTAGGRAYMSAYTDKFVIGIDYIGTVNVYIDGVEQTAMTVSPATYEVELGYHELELRGVSGSNMISYVETTKVRSFTNHAVSGTNTSKLSTQSPTGNVVMVMYGTNDRGTNYGATASNLIDFCNKCLAEGKIVYLFSPIPTMVGGETHTSYVIDINAVINQIPDVNYIDVYKDMMLYSRLSADSLFNDSLHINDLGHKILFVIAASALRLAVKNSILDEE